MTNLPHRARTSGALSLVERGSELASLRARLDAAATGSGQVVTIRGIAGIGKTSLLDEVADEALRRGWRVLQARGDELEQDFAFGVVLQLLEPLIAATPPSALDAVFDGPAALARPLLDQHGERLPDDSELFSVLHGVYWLVANLADDGPVAVLVDDAHWADVASLRWAHYLGKRVHEHPIALVLASRPVGVGPGARILASLMRHEVIDPAPLSPAGIADLLRGERPELATGDLDRWHHLTGGVPLFVQELVRAGDALTTAQAAVDDSLQTVRSRLDRLSPAARSLAEAAAIVGDGAPLWQAARVGGRPDVAAEVRRELVDAALLEDAAEVAFTHPTIREAIERSISASTKQQLHAAVAELLLDASAAPELVARHLMQCPPSGTLPHVEVLERAARRARATGTPDQAVAWLRRALTEAPPEPARTRVLTELAVSEAAAGDDAWSATVDRALRATPSAADRAGLRLRVGRALAFRGRLDGATTVFRQALDDAADEDLGDLRLELLAGLAVASRIDVNRRTDLESELTDALQTADLDTSRAARAVLAHLTYDRALAGEPAGEIRRQGRTAILHPAVDDDEVLENVAYYQALLALHFADDARSVASALERMFDVAARRANETLFGLASNGRCMVRLSQGHVDDALADATAAVEVMRRDRRVTLAGAAGNLALCFLELGDLQRARAALELPASEGHWKASASYTHWLFCSASVRLATEPDDDTGIEELREVVERQRAIGAVNPATIPAPFELAAALARGRPDEAAALHEDAHAVAARFGAPRTLAVSFRSAAVLDPDRAIEHLRAAEDLLLDSPWGLERMRCRTSLGRALITAGRPEAARDPLRLALAEADGAGAVALADAARALLLSTGARPRRTAVSGPAALTPTERSVAQLAAEGRTNREIAAQRFVSVKAVEFHLANAYRKLEITSRSQLASAMSVQ
jgi:DNA-binding CsgD family transcriptional regulator